MKKVLKKIFKCLIKYLLFFSVKTKLGRFIFFEINNNILNNKEKIVHNGQELYFYTPNQLSYFRVKNFSTKEPETLEWIDNFKDNRVFWDIGANIGLYSCYAAKIRQSRVYAFEPSIFNLEWLGKNIFFNNLNNSVVIVPNPLTDVISNANLNFSSTQWSGALTSFGQNYTHDGNFLKKVFQISTVGLTIDESNSILKIPQPDYVKIDVDGIEHLILKGGKKVLFNTKEILIEINDKFEKQTNDCNKYLKELGFLLKKKRQSDLFKGTEYATSYNQIWIKQ